jgi:hypothetical protein
LDIGEISRVDYQIRFGEGINYLPREVLKPVYMSVSKYSYSRSYLLVVKDRKMPVSDDSEK